jgi:hypothetical protein
MRSRCLDAGECLFGARVFGRIEFVERGWVYRMSTSSRIARPFLTLCCEFNYVVSFFFLFVF